MFGITEEKEDKPQMRYSYSATKQEEVGLIWLRCCFTNRIHGRAACVMGFFKVRRILHSLALRMSSSEEFEEKGTKMECFPVES